MIKHKLFYQI